MKRSAANRLVIHATGRRSTLACEHGIAIVIRELDRASTGSQTQFLGDESASRPMVGIENWIIENAGRIRSRERNLVPLDQRGRGAIIERRAQEEVVDSTVIKRRATVKGLQLKPGSADFVFETGRIWRAGIVLSIPIHAHGRLAGILHHSGRRVVVHKSRRVWIAGRRCWSAGWSSGRSRGWTSAHDGDLTSVLIADRRKINNVHRENAGADGWDARIEFDHFRRRPARSRGANNRPRICCTLMNEDVVIRCLPDLRR